MFSLPLSSEPVQGPSTPVIPALACNAAGLDAITKKPPAAMVVLEGMVKFTPPVMRHPERSMFTAIWLCSSIHSGSDAPGG